MGDLLRVTEAAASDAGEATVEIDPETRASSEIDPGLYGKFSEHLGWNVYQGMDAQVLFNPTFGEWKFQAGEPNASGGYSGEYDSDVIARHVEELAARLDYPESEALVDAREHGIAFPWMPLGSDEAVTGSPEAGPARDRAQRIEVQESDDGQGMFQWTHLPLHRVESFEFLVKARARREARVELSIRRVDGDGQPVERLASEEFVVGRSWSSVEGRLDASADAVADDELVAVALTTPESANLVLDRALLYPADHVDRADPEVVEFFGEAGFPLLRWPGGNVVSDYDWRDGVGPIDERPTKQNPAWGGLEYHLFGTDEFLSFCEAVGCEPLICVNAGTGSPEEAAKWVEYCNGDPETTEMGALRADHGHPEPYDVTHWEIGNELYGQWQAYWTTPGGYVDRYERFREAMEAVDPSIEVYACGKRGDWNEQMFAEADGPMTVTDHTLPGGEVDGDTDPEELFTAFASYAPQLAAEYRELRERMESAGIEDPGLAITEMQLFPHLADDETNEEIYTPVWYAGRTIHPDVGLPTNKTIAEAIFHATVVNECVRMGEFVELITHTATVNHGGGLQKYKQRTWADPVHYEHELGHALAGKTAVAIDLVCGTVSTETSFGEIDPVDDVPIVDAVAAVDDDSLAVLLVHRGNEELSLTVETGSFAAAPTADVATLAAESVAAINDFDDPERIIPEYETTAVEDGTIERTLPPRSLTRITVERAE